MDRLPADRLAAIRRRAFGRSAYFWGRDGERAVTFWGDEDLLTLLDALDAAYAEIDARKAASPREGAIDTPQSVPPEIRERLARCMPWGRWP
jgi:hypothetical protein